MILLNLIKAITLIFAIGMVVSLILQGKVVNKNHKKFKKYETIMSIFQYLFLFNVLIIGGIEYFNDLPNKPMSIVLFMIAIIGIILSGILMFKINTMDKSKKRSKLINIEIVILIITIISMILLFSLNPFI